MKRNFGFIGLFLLLALAPVSAFSAGLDSASFTPPELIEPSGGGVPVGTVIVWPVSSNPEDPAKWLECNGQAVSQAKYPKLYALIGTKVPDYRGMFLRGYGSQTHSKNNGSTVGTTSTKHSSGALRQIQGDAIRNFTGTFVANAEWHGSASGVFTIQNYGGAEGWRGDVASRDLFTLDPSRKVPTANEIRPVNMAVRYLIRAAD